MGSSGITVLYPADEGDIDVNLKLGLDIVAVHGLNGDAFWTWTESKSKKLWLRDFLPGDLPSARTMVFGYNAEPFFRSSVAGIEEHARGLLAALVEKRAGGNAPKRPLIFVGHSLGGLVIKQALIIAAREGYLKHPEIFNSTKGVVFFGTPHQGSRFGSYGAALAKVSNPVSLRPPPELLNSLKNGGEQLLELTEEFRKLLSVKLFDIVTFYETKTLKLLWGNLVVEKESALLTPPGETPIYETQIPVEADHREMCRFANSKDKTYRTFVNSVKQILLGGKEVTNEHFLVPHEANPNFTGRYDIRQRLAEALITDRHMKVKSQQRFVLYGLGGAGKTQMCLKFAEDHRNKFWGIFWIDASSIENAREGFLSIARRCKQAENLESIKAWLSGKDDWLLIIDNADSRTLDLKSLFPTGNRGTVLITTRNPDYRQHGNAGSCRVDEMISEDAVALLLKVAHLESTDMEVANAAAKDIVKVLEHLALAIIQAGAVIQQQLCSLCGFCDLYAEQKMRLLESGKAPSDSDYQYSVYTTWEISIMQIEKMSIKNEDALLALDLLRIFSFLHFDNISEEIFKRARNSPDLRGGCYFVETLLFRAMSSGWNQLTFGKALKILSDFSLVTIDNNRRISMHPLVHEWSQARMTVMERWASCDMAASTLGMSMYTSISLKDKQHRKSMLPHINVCLTSVGSQERLFAAGPRLEEGLFIVERFATASRESGRCQLTLDLYTQILKAQKIYLPPGHPRLLYSKEGLAICLHELCHYKEALEIWQALLKEAERNVNRADIARATLGLAIIYQDLGQYKIAVEMMHKAFVTTRSIFGDETIQTLAVKSRLAGCLCSIKDWREGAKLEEEVLASYKKLLPSTHPYVLIEMECLAVSYEALGKAKRGRKLRAQAIAAMEEVLGEDHPSTLQAQMNSAVGSGWTRRKKAIAMKSQVLGKLQKTLGELHLDTVQATSHLARSYLEDGALKQAKLLQEKALEGFIEIYGGTHPQITEAKKLLLMIEMAIGFRKVCYWWIPERFLR